MSLLVVHDEETTRELCATVATQAGLRAAGVASSERALEYLEQSPVNIVIADLKLPGTSGLDLLKRVSELYPQISVIVLTQYGSIDSAIAATRMGALDYVTKRFRVDELRAAYRYPRKRRAAAQRKPAGKILRNCPNPA